MLIICLVANWLRNQFLYICLMSIGCESKNCYITEKTGQHLQGERSQQAFPLGSSQSFYSHRVDAY